MHNPTPMYYFPSRIKEINAISKKIRVTHQIRDYMYVEKKCCLSAIAERRTNIEDWNSVKYSTLQWKPLSRDKSPIQFLLMFTFTDTHFSS